MNSACARASNAPGCAGRFRRRSPPRARCRPCSRSCSTTRTHRSRPAMPALDQRSRRARCCSRPARAPRNERSATATQRPRATSAADRVSKAASSASARSGDAHEQVDVGAVAVRRACRRRPRSACPIVASIGTYSSGSRRLARRPRASSARARPASNRRLRERAREQHHPEFVGARFDRSARSRARSARLVRLQRGDVGDVQPGRPGVVLSEHDLDRSAPSAASCRAYWSTLAIARARRRGTRRALARPISARRCAARSRSSGVRGGDGRFA